MPVRGLSFDFDGSLFHWNYVYSSNKDVIEHNRNFLDRIKNENEAYTKVVSFVGSNRQDSNIDLQNSPNKGSCFPKMVDVNHYLGTHLDKMLLADIYGDLKFGESFEKASKPLEERLHLKHAQWLFDETKTSILYAQMHKMATENPTEEIVFDFFDDRGKGDRSPEDILEWLMKFYGDYPELIPANVTLRLNHYNGGDVTNLAEIKGTGIIDANYRQTVKDMGAITKEKQDAADWDLLYIGHHIKPEDLVNRKDLALTGSNKDVCSPLILGLFSAGTGLTGAGLLVAGIVAALTMSTLWPVGLVVGGAALLATAGFFGYKALGKMDNQEFEDTSSLHMVFD